MKFSKQAIAALTMPKGKREHFEWDDDLPGFGARLRSGVSLSLTWVIQYRINGKQRRESLGDVRKVSLEDARKIARQRFAKVELGVDPAAERTQARARALTLEVVAGRYLDAKRDRMRRSTLEGAERYFAQHWKPLHDHSLDAIKRADVAARLQELVKVHGRTSAARARGNLSALYGWAMREGLCESNPVLATNDPTEGMPTRDRVLNDSELRAVWNACENDDFGRIVKLLLLSGCRRDEIGGLSWSEIDLDTGVMTIPGTRTKNHRTLELMLPEVAIDILRSQPRRREDYVFGVRGGAFTAWSYSTVKLHARIVEAEGKRLVAWRLHDLRRTMRTNLGKLNIQPHIAELAINHVRGGVEGIYDRHRYQREIGAALATWAEYLLALIEGRQSKVVTLQRA
jgi:integrase